MLTARDWLEIYKNYGKEGAIAPWKATTLKTTKVKCFKGRHEDVERKANDFIHYMEMHHPDFELVSMNPCQTPIGVALYVTYKSKG